MKKLIPGILSMLLCLGFATGCDAIKLPGFLNKDSSTTESTESTSTPDSTPEDSSSAPTSAHEKDLKDVKDYIQGIVNEMNLETNKSFKLINTYSFFGETAKYDIAWSANIEGITIEEGEGQDTIVIGEFEEDTPYVLTAKITDPDGCHFEEATFDAVAVKAASLIPEMITAKPVENTVYKLYVYQSTLAQDMFFNGNTAAATYYFGTTLDAAEAVDVYVEYIANSDNFYVSYTFDGAKKYIGIRLSDDGAHDNIVATESPISEFFWNAELGTICTHLDVNKNGEASDYYLGNYGTKDTISCSMISYAGGSGNNVGGLATLVDKNNATPDDKVATEKDKVSIEKSYTGANTVNLPTVGNTYSDVAINWTVKSGDVTIANNVLTIADPATETTAVITATFTCGTASTTADIEITLKPGFVLPADGTTLTIPQALELGAKLNGAVTEQKYYVSGTVSGTYGDKWATYGNLYIKDAEGNEILIYGLYNADGTVKYGDMDVKPVVGDTITVLAALTSYNGTAQFKNGWVKEHTPGSGTVTPPVEPSDPNATTVTLSFADTAIRTESTTEKQVWEQNGITFTYEKGASTQDIKEYNAPIRLYANTQFTIACTGMKSITFTYNTGKPISGLTDTLTAAGVSYTVDETAKTVVITFAEAQDSFSVVGLLAQVRIESISITK